MGFGDQLKKLRESRGMTVNQLAMYSGISAASISRYETGDRGTPKPPTIEKLAKGLKIDYKELMRVAGYYEDPDEEVEKADEIFLKDIDELELTEEQIIEKYNLKVDGIPLTKEQVRHFINFIRAGRML